MPYDEYCCRRWPTMPRKSVTGHPKRNRKKIATARRANRKQRQR